MPRRAAGPFLALAAAFAAWPVGAPSLIASAIADDRPATSAPSPAAALTETSTAADVLAWISDRNQQRTADLWTIAEEVIDQSLAASSGTSASGAAEEVAKLASAAPPAPPPAGSAPDLRRLKYAKAKCARALGRTPEARDLMAQVVKEGPDVAEFWALRGTTIFETINSAPTADKLGLADEGKAAYEQAIKLEPNSIEARTGLAMYYINAPAIFGGSYRKARDQGKALIAAGGDRESAGYQILAQVAAADEEWDDAAKFYLDAEKAAKLDNDRAMSLNAAASTMVRKVKNYKSATAVIERYRALRPADGIADSLLGEIRHAEKKWGEAIPLFRAALDINPRLRSRFLLAQCLDETGYLRTAAAEFERFAADHPNDDRAEKAADRARSLRKKLK